MKKLLNTLYVTTPSAYLFKDGTNVVVSDNNKELFRIPVQNLESIITFGYQGASPGVMRLCAENGVGLSFFSPHGKFIARMQGPVTGNIHLRHSQHRSFPDSDIALHLASVIVAGKIHNSRAVVRRFIRDYPSNPSTELMESVSKRLHWHGRLTVGAPKDIDEIRGIEGQAAKDYFEVFPHLILNNKSFFRFTGRNRRPPTDPVNALLSFGYSLLASDCASALEGVGLDPYMGVLHAMRPGRPSLALDIMEELRAYIVDRFVISLINNRQMNSSHFQIHTNENTSVAMPVLLNENGRKVFLSAWQSRKRTEITHPFLGEKISLGILPHVQALLLARYMRGDLDDYPVFIIK